MEKEQHKWNVYFRELGASNNICMIGHTNPTIEDYHYNKRVILDGECFIIISLTAYPPEKTMIVFVEKEQTYIDRLVSMNEESLIWKN